MKSAGIISMVVGAALLVGSAAAVQTEVRAASKRLKTGVVAEQQKSAVAVANDAEASYCTPQFKTVLARVIHACALPVAASGAVASLRTSSRWRPSTTTISMRCLRRSRRAPRS